MNILSHLHISILFLIFAVVFVVYFAVFAVNIHL